MLSEAVRIEVLQLAHSGVNDTEIARRLGVARTTVRDIRAPRYVRQRPSARCPRCWQPAAPLDIAPARYAYLLGLYLGDGCIAELPRTFSLRLSLDTKYPGIVDEARAAMESFSATQRVSEHRAGPRKTVTVLCVYGKHIPCLFPQHGSGKKHLRQIALEPWQNDIVDAHPWPLLRGLIQSDGCRFINRTGPYSYPSYDFGQLSEDIKAIFANTCERVGVECRPYKRGVRVNRRASVELMDRYIGPKS